jgi:hypothetical protein
MNVQETAAHTEHMAHGIETLRGSAASASDAARQVGTTRSTLEQQLGRLQSDIQAFLARTRAS